MAASSKITAMFTATAQGMQKGIGNVVSSLNSVTKTSAKTQKALSRMTSGINFLVFDRLAQYALAAGRAFKNMVSGSINAIDAVDKLAKSTGISTEGLQVFGLAAEKAGVDQRALSGAFGRMSKRLAEATQGFGEALPALERLGLSAQDLTKLTPEEQFLKIGEAIGGLATQGEQAAAAFKIFSDQGLRLVPLFADINEQTEAARAELERFGGILSSQQIAGTVALKDNLTDVSQIFSNIVNQVTANLAPAINAVVDAFKEFVSSAGGANIGKGISDAIIAAVDYALGFADYIAPLFGSVLDGAAEVGASWENVGFLLEKTFDIADRVGKLWLAGFYEIQGIFNWLLSKIAESLANWVDLFESFGFDAGNIEETLRGLSQGMSEEVLKSQEKAQAAWKAAFAEGSGDASKAVEGGLQQRFRDYLAEIQSLRPTQPETQKVELSDESKKALTAQNKISGLDARSQAGLNFLLQSGVAGNTVEDKQLATQKQIAKNTAQPGINVIQMGIA